MPNKTNESSHFANHAEDFGFTSVSKQFCGNKTWFVTSRLDGADVEGTDDEDDCIDVD